MTGRKPQVIVEQITYTNTLCKAGYGATQIIRETELLHMSIERWLNKSHEKANSQAPTTSKWLAGSKKVTHKTLRLINSQVT